MADYNVQSYGAVADNNQSSATTNLNAFKAAISAATATHSAFGGTARVIVPAGSYYLNGGIDLNVVSGLEFIGDGSRLTVLRLANGVTLTDDSSGYNGFIRVPNQASNQFDIRIRGFYLDGNKANSSANGITLHNLQQTSSIEDVWVTAFSGVGIWDAKPSTYPSGLKRFVGVESIDTGGTCWQIEGNNNVFVNCHGENPDTGYCFDLQGPDNVLIGCHVEHPSGATSGNAAIRLGHRATLISCTGWSNSSSQTKLVEISSSHSDNGYCTIIGLTNQNGYTIPLIDMFHGGKTYGYPPSSTSRPPSGQLNFAAGFANHYNQLNIGQDLERGASLQLSGNTQGIVGTNSATADATAKAFRVACLHYSNSQVPVLLIQAQSDGSSNTVQLGGTSSGGINNSATAIQFYTAPNTTTLNGWLRMALDSNGRLGLGLQSPSYGQHFLGGQTRYQTVATPAAPTLSAGSPGTAYYYWIIYEDRGIVRTPPSPSVGTSTNTGITLTLASWLSLGVNKVYVLRTTTSATPTGNPTALVATFSAGETTFSDSNITATSLGFTIAPRNTTADVTMDGSCTASLLIAGQDLQQGASLQLSGNTQGIVGTNTVTTDATAKAFRVASLHYTNSQAPVLLIQAQSDGSSNTVQLGGTNAGGVNNSATAIQFYTAPNTTTLNGWLRMALDSNGRLGLGLPSPLYGQHFLGGRTRCQTVATPAAPTLSAGSSGTTYYYWIIYEDRGVVRTLPSPSVGTSTNTGITLTLASWVLLGVNKVYVLRTTTSAAPTGNPTALVATLSAGETTFSDSNITATSLGFTIPSRNATADVTMDGLCTVSSLIEGLATPTYSATITPDATLAIQKIAPTDGNPFTIANPINASAGMSLLFDILNSSSGSLGTITWGSTFKLAGAFTNPATSKRRTISFYNDGSNWIETGRVGADI